MKITLVGRPGKVVKNKGAVMVAMENKNIPTLPKGFPKFPAYATTYLVYIPYKQWQRVDKYIANPDDTLIVEGFPFYDHELKKMSVFVFHTSTTQLNKENREKQRKMAE